MHKYCKKSRQQNGRKTGVQSIKSNGHQSLTEATTLSLQSQQGSRFGIRSTKNWEIVPGEEMERRKKGDVKYAQVERTYSLILGKEQGLRVEGKNIRSGLEQHTENDHDLPLQFLNYTFLEGKLRGWAPQRGKLRGSLWLWGELWTEHITGDVKSSREGGGVKK